VVQQAFVGVSVLLFAASAAVTIVWCASMSAMGEMPMPGGWTMSMAWMRMPGQTWPGAAASFIGMWVVMMAAMMLPSLVPMLSRYRQAVGRTGETRLGRLTAIVGVGYFFVWTVFGMAAFPLGVALATIEMQQPALARAVPIAVGVVVIGVMDLRAMAVVAAAITIERLAPAGERVAQAIGAVVVGAGLFLIARAPPVYFFGPGKTPSCCMSFTSSK
jgi:predicted metal-binding membrane protein